MSGKMTPWMYIVLGWMVLLLATAATIHVCQRNAPQSVPLENLLPAVTSHAR